MKHHQSSTLGVKRDMNMAQCPTPPTWELDHRDRLQILHWMLVKVSNYHNTGITEDTM